MRQSVKLRNWYRKIFIHIKYFNKFNQQTCAFETSSQQAINHAGIVRKEGSWLPKKENICETNFQSGLIEKRWEKYK